VLRGAYMPEISTAGRIHGAPEFRGVAMVFQDLALWPHMSVAENIGFGLRARQVPTAERKRRVAESRTIDRLLKTRGARRRGDRRVETKLEKSNGTVKN
jgi:ABC-type sugar transport system ATPase subunit